MKYLSIIITLILITYGQLILKHEINNIGTVSSATIVELYRFFFKALTNIGILSGLLAAFIAALCWMYALGKFQLSSIYPLLSLNFIFVPLLSIYFFNEDLSLYKLAGI